MLSLVTELMEYEYSGRQEQLTTIREVIVKGDFAAVRVDAPADPAREWGYVGVLLRRTDAGWRVAGVAGAAVHHLPPGTFRQWLDVMVAFQLAEGGWGWVVDRLLLYRLVPLKQPILAGTAPTLTVEVLNVSDETVFWECQNEITLGVALPGVIGGWLSPKFSYSVQIDGQWFQRTIITASSGSLDFGPGKQFLDTGIRLIGLELKDQTTHRALELKPGKHTVRVAFTAEGDKAVRAVSNPVEIMVLPSRPSLVFASGSLRPALDYPSKWAVYAQVPEKEITKVAAGQEAAFTLEAFSGRVFHGHVERVADRPVTSENVVTYEVVIPVADPDPKFKDGMTATITLMGGGSAAAAPPPPPAETKPAAAASAPGRLLFHGLDLANAPGTSQWKDLPDLFEERPPGSKSYEMRKGLQPVYQGLDGTVYYLPVRGIFYVQADPAGSSTLHYYGPFKGKPREQMRLPEDPSGEAKLDFLWNFPELHELDLSISEKALQRMIAEKGLRNTCTEDSKTKAYHVYRRDGENVIVMFDKDGKCAGVQRMRTDASQADRLFNGLGKDAKSLEVCLRVDKTVWKVGDDLALKADVRNTGQEAVALYVDGNNYWGIEVDGQWYSSDTTTTALVAPMLGPGEQFVDISVPPTWIPSALSHWYDCSDEVPWRRGKKQLTLEPGRHTIRVGVYPVLVDSGASEAKAAPSASGKPVDRILTVQVTPGKPVPAVSNAVEIEVQPAAPSVAPAR